MTAYNNLGKMSGHTVRAGSTGSVYSMSYTHKSGETNRCLTSPVWLRILGGIRTEYGKRSITPRNQSIAPPTALKQKQHLHFIAPGQPVVDVGIRILCKATGQHCEQVK